MFVLNKLSESESEFMIADVTEALLVGTTSLLMADYEINLLRTKY